MSGSHFIAQTNNFLLIDGTAVTLGQGHGKVIEYITPDPYILCAKYIYGLAQTVLTWEARVVAAADAAAAADATALANAAAAADAAETNWKHKITPDWGDLKC